MSDFTFMSERRRYPDPKLAVQTLNSSLEGIIYRKDLPKTVRFPFSVEGERDAIPFEERFVDFGNGVAGTIGEFQKDEALLRRGINLATERFAQLYTKNFTGKVREEALRSLYRDRRVLTERLDSPNPQDRGSAIYHSSLKIEAAAQIRPAERIPYTPSSPIPTA